MDRLLQRRRRRWQEGAGETQGRGGESWGRRRAEGAQAEGRPGRAAAVEAGTRSDAEGRAAAGGAVAGDASGAVAAQFLPARRAARAARAAGAAAGAGGATSGLGEGSNGRAARGGTGRGTGPGAVARTARDEEEKAAAAAAERGACHGDAGSAAGERLLLRGGPGPAPPAGRPGPARRRGRPRAARRAGESPRERRARPCPRPAARPRELRPGPRQPGSQEPGLGPVFVFCSQSLSQATDSSSGALDFLFLFFVLGGGGAVFIVLFLCFTRRPKSWPIYIFRSALRVPFSLENQDCTQMGEYRKCFVFVP